MRHSTDDRSTTQIITMLLLQDSTYFPGIFSHKSSLDTEKFEGSVSIVKMNFHGFISEYRLKWLNKIRVSIIQYNWHPSLYGLQKYPFWSELTDPSGSELRVCVWSVSTEFPPHHVFHFTFWVRKSYSALSYF